MRNFKTINSENMALEMARYRVRKIRRFYTHLFIFSIVGLIYIVNNYFEVPFNFLPIGRINKTFMWIWTLIIVVQGVRLFFRENVFGTDWEQRKTQEFLNKDKQNKWQ